MPYTTSYDLPDGTTLTVELNSPTLQQMITNDPAMAPIVPEKWTREGWIECCHASAVSLVDSGIARDVRFRRASNSRYDLKIVEEVTDPARRYDLMSKALGLIESRDTREWITYNSCDANVPARLGHWLSY